MDVWLHVAGRVEEVNPDNTSNLSQAEISGALQVDPWISFLRRYVSGFFYCRLSGIPSTIRVRETNHMHGVYTHTADNLLSERIFSDGCS